ncbi:MAG TPA: hypothetical protein VLW55_26825 [Burkholderiaceae bacterium]|nr:hypothetical protein [Burkholderiaceae bacterium]
MRLQRLACVGNYLAMGVLLAGVAGTALAETPRDQYWIGLSYFYPTITSTVRVDVPGTRLGSTVRLEDELGLSDRKGTPYFLAGMRIGSNWRIEFEYYALNRDATRTTNRNIDFGDITFQTATQINTKFDTGIYRLTGGYAFIKTPDAEFGGALGLHMTDFKIQLAGTGSVTSGGTTTAASFQREERTALVPLPTLGLYGSYLFADQFVLRGRVDYLSLTYDKYHGSLVNWFGGFDWRFLKNVGAGVGYRYVNYKLSSTNTHVYGEVNYNFKGPTIYLEAAF